MIVQKDLPIIRDKIENGLIAIASDFHFPFQDDMAINAFLQYINIKQPQVIVLNGDVLDFYRLSRFVKGTRGRSVGEEMAMVRNFLTELRETCPQAKIYYPIGNHETRYEKYCCQYAPELIDATVDFHRSIGCEELDIQGCSQVVFNDKFLCKHGNVVSKRAGMTAIKELEMAYMSGASGHTHRLCLYITRRNGIKYFWLETGCLCSLDPEYMLYPDWQQGFCTVEIRDGEVYKAACHQIEKGVVL